MSMFLQIMYDFIITSAKDGYKEKLRMFLLIFFVQPSAHRNQLFCPWAFLSLGIRNVKEKTPSIE